MILTLFGAVSLAIYSVLQIFNREEIISYGFMIKIVYLYSLFNPDYNLNCLWEFSTINSISVSSLNTGSPCFQTQINFSLLWICFLLFTSITSHTPQVTQLASFRRKRKSWRDGCKLKISTKCLDHSLPIKFLGDKCFSLFM